MLSQCLCLPAAASVARDGNHLVLLLLLLLLPAAPQS
jgi:hypothetical protein